MTLALVGRAAIGPIALAMLASCALTASPDQPVTMRLEPAFASSSGPRVDKSVAVAPVQASGAIAGLRYAYVDTSKTGVVSQAATLFWDQPPALIAQHALVDGLRTRFATVSGPEVSLPSDIRVVTVLDHFEEVTGGASKAEVGFDASVIEGGKIRQSGKYCAAAPIGGATPSDRVRAFESALTQAVGALAQDIASPGSASASSC